jgi:hypothetical protein
MVGIIGQCETEWPGAMMVLGYCHFTGRPILKIAEVIAALDSQRQLAHNPGHSQRYAPQKLCRHPPAAKRAFKTSPSASGRVIAFRAQQGQ